MIEDRYFDDFKLGETFVSPGITITESEIIDFALKYDPQPFHLDAEAAAESPYGGLIASGIQTQALCFRMFTHLRLIAVCSMGSPGIDELRWLAPVRPGDTLHTVAEVREVSASRSKPTQGTLRMHYSAVNQHGNTVLTMLVMHILKRRPGQAEEMR